MGTLIGDLMIKHNVKYGNKKSLISLIIIVLLVCIGYRLMIIGYVKYEWYKIDKQIKNGEMIVYPDKE